MQAHAAAGGDTALAVSAAQVPGDGQTRAAVVRLLLEEGPITATAIGGRLGLSAAGVRRHLEALIDSGQARALRPAAWQHKGRGRPAKQYQLTASGRARLGHTYDDLASAAMRQLRDLGGDAAIKDFARKRVQAVVADIDPIAEHSPEATAEKAAEIADAFASAGFAASTRKVGNGVQLCQHHCPVSHVAEEFPALCEAEIEAFRELLGTHVQRLATIANGNDACTTNVPLLAAPEAAPGKAKTKTSRTQPRTTQAAAQPAPAHETPEGAR
jgi:predicted ArsR family transcriptional regulator